MNPRIWLAIPLITALACGEEHPPDARATAEAASPEVASHAPEVGAAQAPTIEAPARARPLAFEWSERADHSPSYLNHEEGGLELERGELSWNLVSEQEWSRERVTAAWTRGHAVSRDGVTSAVLFDRTRQVALVLRWRDGDATPRLETEVEFGAGEVDEVRIADVGDELRVYARGSAHAVTTAVSLEDGSRTRTDQVPVTLLGLRGDVDRLGQSGAEIVVDRTAGGGLLDRLSPPRRASTLARGPEGEVTLEYTEEGETEGIDEGAYLVRRDAEGAVVWRARVPLRWCGTALASSAVATPTHVVSMAVSCERADSPMRSPHPRYSVTLTSRRRSDGEVERRDYRWRQRARPKLESAGEHFVLHETWSGLAISDRGDGEPGYWQVGTRTAHDPSTLAKVYAHEAVE